MEGIYQNNLYAPQQLPYVLPPTSADGQQPHPYSHYGSQQQHYRSSAFSDARSSPPSTPYHHHSAGLNAASSNNYASHGSNDMNNHQSHHHHPHHHNNNNTHTNNNDNYNHHGDNTNWASNSPNLPWSSSPPPPLPPPSRNNSYGGYNTLPHMSSPMQRPKLTTTVWEDEGTLCYQVDAKSVCVARRQDNDMINGTKLLNVVGMSRGKRDGILKNEKGRVVVKVGAMHLKGVWITFNRAKDLANKFKITDILYPLFVEDPSVFLSVPPPPPAAGTTTTATGSNNVLPIMLPSATSAGRGGSYYNSKNESASFGSFNLQSWEKQSYQSLPSITNGQQDQMIIRSQQQQHNNNNNNIQQNSGSCSPVPGSIPQPSILSNEESDLYLLNNSYEYRGDSRYNNHTTSTSSPHPYSLYSTHENHASEGRNQFSSPYENNASPYMHSTASRKQSIGIETKDEDKRSIDFPSSPPPESSSTTIKYGNTSSPPSWSDFTANNTTSVNRKTSLGSSSTIRTAGLVTVPGCHPLSNEIEDNAKSFPKGRKRGHQQDSLPMIQRKRTKNNDTTASSP